MYNWRERGDSLVENQRQLVLDSWLEFHKHSTLSTRLTVRSLLVFDSSVVAVAQSDFVTHVARAVSTKSNGAHIENSESTLDVAPKTTSSASANPTASGNSTGLAGVTGVEKISPPGPGWQGWQGCFTGQKTSILDGFCEAHTVLGTRGVYYIDYHWNDFVTVEDLGSLEIESGRLAI